MQTALINGCVCCECLWSLNQRYYREIEHLGSYCYMSHRFNVVLNCPSGRCSKCQVFFNLQWPLQHNSATKKSHKQSANNIKTKAKRPSFNQVSVSVLLDYFMLKTWNSVPGSIASFNRLSSHIMETFYIQQLFSLSITRVRLYFEEV